MGKIDKKLKTWRIYKMSFLYAIGIIAFVGSLIYSMYKTVQSFTHK